MVISHLVPLFQQIPMLNNQSPLLRLWISTANATALPHYDLEDNLFFQLSGSKTFIIASPQIVAWLLLSLCLLNIFFTTK